MSCAEIHAIFLQWPLTRVIALPGLVSVYLCTRDVISVF